MSTKSNFCLIDREIICNQTVTIFGTFENPLFLAKEVSSWIGHSDTNAMCRSIDEDEKIKLFVTSDFQKGFRAIIGNLQNQALTQVLTTFSLQNLAFTKS